MTIDDERELRRRLDSVLEMPGRQHRLIFPPIRLDREEPSELLLKLVDDERRPQTFIRNVTRRRYEYSEQPRHEIMALRPGRITAKRSRKRNGPHRIMGHTGLGGADQVAGFSVFRS